MKKIVFVVEKTETGFSAYAEDFEKNPVGTTGTSMAELKEQILNAINLYKEHNGENPVTEEDIPIRLDVAQFFEYYKEINATALGKRVGMNKALLSQYVNGHKKPGPKQVHKIIEGIKSLAKELESLELEEA
ncbi:hypothetical protein [Rubrolithibacter danxiaensis]|uniref:hypothetical protein n=1 Tax=Rubrolithibacter danxiaensis TaxID=3390805 RepID=UPI003BF845A3